MLVKVEVIVYPYSNGTCMNTIRYMFLVNRKKLWKAPKSSNLYFHQNLVNSFYFCAAADQINDSNTILQNSPVEGADKKMLQNIILKNSVVP